MHVRLARLDPGLNVWLESAAISASGTTQVVLRGQGWERAFIVQTPQTDTMILTGRAPHADLVDSQRSVQEEAAFLAGTRSWKRPRRRRILLWTLVGIAWVLALVAGIGLVLMDSAP